MKRTRGEEVALGQMLCDYNNEQTVDEILEQDNEDTSVWEPHEDLWRYDHKEFCKQFMSLVWSVDRRTEPTSDSEIAELSRQNKILREALEYISKSIVNPISMVDAKSQLAAIEQTADEALKSCGKIGVKND